MFQKDFYKGKSHKEIEESIRHEGFDPSLFSNSAGDVYSPHRHAETKLLAFLKGSMKVTVGNKAYQCKAGDRILIPGNVRHSASVGSDGCVFFWSEKIIND